MQKKTSLVLFLLGIFFSASLFLAYKGRSNLVSTAFEGKIDSISYDEKMIPTVFVKGIRYHLTPLRKEFVQKVRVGDFIEKKSDQACYIITKQKTEEIINFEF